MSATDVPSAARKDDAHIDRDWVVQRRLIDGDRAGVRPLRDDVVRAVRAEVRHHEVDVLADEDRDAGSRLMFSSHALIPLRLRNTATSAINGGAESRNSAAIPAAFLSNLLLIVILTVVYRHYYRDGTCRAMLHVA